MAQGPTISILVTVRITVRIQESEVRNPDSLDNRKSFLWILMKLYGELGCGLENNWLLHFGDDPHHYPDPGFRSGSRSGSGKYWCSAEVCAVWVLLVSICNNCSHCSDWRPDGDCARWVLFLFLESWCQRFEIELKSINAGNFIKFCTVFADYRHSIWTRQLKRTYVLRSEEVVLKSFLLPSVLSWRKSAQTPYISVSAGRNKHSQREA